MKRLLILLSILLVIANAGWLVPATAEYLDLFAIASLVLAVALLAVVLAQRPAAVIAPKPAIADAAKPPAAAISSNHAQAEVITLLAIFQEKGRLIDFLMEDITPYNDAEVGSVARGVHQGCKAALAGHFQIEPIAADGEGAPITVPAGYRAEDFRLVGNLTGEPPFAGKVVHKGWRTTSVKLPRVLTANDHRLPPIAPAQVEVQ